MLEPSYILQKEKKQHPREIIQINMQNHQLSNIQSIRAFTSLVSINLSHNSLTNANDLLSLLNIRSIDLSYNNLSSFLAIPALPQLENLNLKRNSLFLLQLNGCNNLRDVDVSDNQLTVLDGLQSCNKLEILNIQWNQIQDITQFNFLKKCPIKELFTQGNTAESEALFDAKLKEMITTLMFLNGKTITYTPDLDNQQRFTNNNNNYYQKYGSQDQDKGTYQNHRSSQPENYDQTFASNQQMQNRILRLEDRIFMLEQQNMRIQDLVMQLIQKQQVPQVQYLPMQQQIPQYYQQPQQHIDPNLIQELVKQQISQQSQFVISNPVQPQISHPVITQPPTLENSCITNQPIQLASSMHPIVENTNPKNIQSLVSTIHIVESESNSSIHDQKTVNFKDQPVDSSPQLTISTQDDQETCPKTAVQMTEKSVSQVSNHQEDSDSLHNIDFNSTQQSQPRNSETKSPESLQDPAQGIDYVYNLAAQHLNKPKPKIPPKPTIIDSEVISSLSSLNIKPSNPQPFKPPPPKQPSPSSSFNASLISEEPSPAKKPPQQDENSTLSLRATPPKPTNNRHSSSSLDLDQISLGSIGRSSLSKNTNTKKIPVNLISDSDSVDAKPQNQFQQKQPKFDDDFSDDLSFNSVSSKKASKPQLSFLNSANSTNSQAFRPKAAGRIQIGKVEKSEDLDLDDWTDDV